MAGELDVLSCGLGHAELRFDKDDPIESERARRAIETLLRTGCVLFVKGDDDVYTRVESFDPKTDSYVISDVPEPPSAEEDDQDEHDNETEAKGKPAAGKVKKATKKTSTRKRKSAKRKVPASSVDATAVPMRAGG